MPVTVKRKRERQSSFESDSVGSLDNRGKVELLSSAPDSNSNTRSKRGVDVKREIENGKGNDGESPDATFTPNDTSKGRAGTSRSKSKKPRKASTASPGKASAKSKTKADIAAVSGADEGQGERQGRAEPSRTLSIRARVAEAVVLAGLAGVDKKALAQELGISPQKQVDLLRSDKGVVYKVLMDVVRDL